MRFSEREFAETAEGRTVWLSTLSNRNGITMKVINYGGIIVSLEVPDKDGNLEDIVLGCNSLDDYISGSPYFGAIIGRCGNRIGQARFLLRGTEYSLAANDGENHLHGGLKGFDKVIWDAEEISTDSSAGLRLSYFSPDGEENYPGNLSVTVDYVLTDADALRISYRATTDKTTIVNLTNHSYFNLAGAGNGDILNHELLLRAGSFTPIDETLIPIGEIRPVKGTPLDFSTLTRIGDRIDLPDKQLEFGGGYDHNWVLDRQDQSLAQAAILREPSSGRIVEVLTTEPGIQFYSGNFLDGSAVGKEAIRYAARTGLCLETQHFPDSINKPEFPSVILEPGDEYSSTTVFAFSVG